MTGTRKRIIVGAVSAVLAAICLLIAFADMQGQVASARDEAVERYGGEQVEVLVARRDLAVGQTLSEADVEMRTWVSALLPEGALRSVESAVGQRVSVPLFSGEPVIAAKVGDEENSIDVPSGRSAVTVPADNVSALGGSLCAGTRVEVYTTVGTAPTLLASDVTVLETSSSSVAMGTSSSSSLFSSSSASTIAWVTLAVPPERVQETIAAASADALYLVLPGTSGEAAAGSDNSKAAGNGSASLGTAEGAAAVSGGTAVSGSTGGGARP